VRTLRLGMRRFVGSEVLRSYWFVAAERQNVYFKRLAGGLGPWTDDPILSRFRFTNAYRAADRVSQDLIRAQYIGSQAPEDIVFRTILYRFFNKPSTWNLLVEEFGEISWRTFDVDKFDIALSRKLDRRETIYSAAYILPPPPFGATRKHRNHLLLLEFMMKSGLVEDLLRAPSLKSVFEVIASYPSLGPFLAYQLAIDLNYSSLLNFDENDFVVAGPGAKSGIAKCFPDSGGLAPEEIIRWMVDNQEDEFEHYELDFQDLFGRPLTLIDCQNLFCETDKYARVAHPLVKGVGSRTRIKQQFSPVSLPSLPFFPPKWGLQSRVSEVAILQ
jgi:hypothetical protein